MHLTIHRGTREIGGSCVELRSGDCRIILDVGKPLPKPGTSHSDRRKWEKIPGPELYEMGYIPRVEGLYEWQVPTISGVLISHAHQDHYGFVNYVHPKVPVYMGEGTKRLIEITAQFTRSEIHLKNPQVFSWPSTFLMGEFNVTPHLVDHSSFGAFAFEIEARGKRLFYSGDFRGHGYLGKTLDIIARKCASGVDALIMEGTMLGRKGEQVLSEQDLADEAKRICRECPRAVLVYQSGQNVSRAVSFYKAAVSSGREFVLDVYTAHVLAELGQYKGGDNLPYPGNLPGIRVWYPNRLTSRLKNEGQGAIVDRFGKTRFKMSRNDMPERLDKIMLYVRPGMECDIERISGIEGSVLLYSLWKGYREEGTTKKFLDTLNGLGISERYLHTSGHAPIPELQRLVDIVQPSRLFPIHTEYPDDFEQFRVPVGKIADGVPVEL